MNYEQIDLFEETSPHFRFNKPIRLIELFGGIGSQAKALKNLGIDFEHYKLVEFDKYAIRSYNAIHGTNFEIKDINKITWQDLEIIDVDKYDYVMTYSFPCQDLSLAGKGAGMTKGTKTRSGLLWEVERLLEECKEHSNLPQVLLMENVPQVHGSGNIRDFQDWVYKLEQLGYSNYCEDLNAKNYGIPQNRNRCFVVSILGSCFYKFPKPFPLKLRLKDMLEDKVDKKYYLFKKTNLGNEIIPTLITEPKFGVVVIGQVSTEESQAGKIYDPNGLSPTLCAGTHGYAMGNIAVKETNTTICLNSKVNGQQPKVQNRIYDSKGISTAITTVFMPNIEENLKIRKLTPLECWRLMGFSDEDFKKAKAAGVSDSQLYKQAGNSIVVNVLMAIFKQMI